MKVVILAGGFGTRLGEYTDLLPKPMVSIGGSPILLHIMNIYSAFGHEDFFLALGYKADVVKDYFLNHRARNSDFTINLADGSIVAHQGRELKWRVTLVDTGLNSMTGGRVKRMRDYVGNETFMLTYGDGVSDIDLHDLLQFHKSHGKLATVSAVRPPARFGELDIQERRVKSFKEKPQTSEGWVNGGFFVLEPGFFDLIENDATVLEREPLERAAQMDQLMAYKHPGYWQCMDTKRDRDALEELWASGGAPWKRK